MFVVRMVCWVHMSSASTSRTPCRCPALLVAPTETPNKTDSIHDEVEGLISRKPDATSRGLAPSRLPLSLENQPL